ncbi:MAG: intradiol ring-cleavage dioxygenase [Acidobacteriota bacterium]
MKVNRRSVLEGIGFLGLGTAARGLTGAVGALLATPAAPARAQTSNILAPSCWMTPEKTEGPYYFDPNLIRRDITEGKTGIPLTLGIGVVDVDCTPVPNLLVDVWHADKDGLYSGYSQPAGNTRGQTFLRGTQPTDADGIAYFQTIYPGWYQGRATHIHFKVRIPDQTYVTSQFAFSEAVNNAVYATPLYATRGRNPTTNAADGIFRSADPTYLEVSVTPNAAGGYDGVFAIGLSVSLAGGFHALSRCTLVDTRNRESELGGPALAANATRTFTAADHCDVPSGAKALVADVSVLKSKRAGSLKLFAAGADPATVAGLAFRAKRSNLNEVHIPLSDEGAFSVRSNRSAHLLIDVTGYYD